MKERFVSYKKYIIIVVIILLGLITLFNYKKNDSNITLEKKDKEISLISNTEDNIKSFYVDIKGAVKKPSVYEFNDGDKVIDAIKKAGGLSKNATTDNINLSQKLKSEMVIYIFTKSELKNNNKNKVEIANESVSCKCETIKVNNCIEPKTTVIPTTTKDITNNVEEEIIVSDSTNTNNNLININTANINELTSLSGIGESKAKAIIEYREKNGYFKKIEDIMNVSGLGEALFGKIKDSITVG